MKRRSLVSGVLIAAGLLLCAVSVQHYARGWRAQREAEPLYRAELSKAASVAEASAVG